MKKRLLSMCMTLAMSLAPVLADEILLYEDFSKCAAGGIELADDVNIATTADDPYGTGMIDAYTLTPGWSAYGLYQAGGTAVLKGIDMYGYVMSELKSPAISREGGLRVRVKARLYQGDGIADPVRMRVLFAKGWTYSPEEYYTVTSEWQEFTYETKVSAGDWQMRISVANEDASVFPVQFDEISIEAFDMEAKRPDAPLALDAADITDTSFTARWQTVKGIADYKLYVTYEEGGETRNFLDGEKISLGTWSSPVRRVTGLDPETVYSYHITAVDGDLESEPSNTVDVLALSIPSEVRFTDPGAGSLACEWSRTPKADRYCVTLFRLTENGPESVSSATTSECSYSFVEADTPGYWACAVRALRDFKGNTVESAMSPMRAAAIGVTTDGKNVLTEDFSKFTNGSLEEIFYKEYDNQDPNAWGEYVNDFQGETIPDEYTRTPGWKGFGVAEAGGVAAVSYKPYSTTYWGGYVQTPRIGAKSIVTLHFRAASIPQYFTASEDNPVKLYINLTTGNSSAADVYVFGRESDGIHTDVYIVSDIDTEETARVEDNYFTLTDNDWHEFTATFLYTGDAAVSVAIDSQKDNTPFFIDDIAVDVKPLFIDAPVAWEADGFTRDGFTAYWGEVEDADDYLLSVYRRKGGKNDYSITDMVCKTTEQTVTGLDAAYDWFFTVKARCGEAVSAESNVVPAIWVNSPVVLPATEIMENGFTSNWEKAPKATRYDLVLYRGDEESGLTEISTVEIEEGDATSYSFRDLDIESGLHFAYALKSYYDATAETYESPLSDPVYVEVGSDAVVVPSAESFVTKEGHCILIKAPAGTRVGIYDMEGILLRKTVSSGSELRFDTAGGVYVVTLDGKTVKIIL